MKSEKKKTLSDVRELGALHLELGDKTSNDLEKLINDRYFFEQTLSFLDPELAKPDSEILDYEKTHELAEETNNLHEAIKNKRDVIERYVRERDRIIEWGVYNPKDFISLEKNNIYVRLYDVSPEKLDRVRENAKVFEIQRDRNRVLAAAFFSSSDQISEVQDIPEFPIPDKGISEIEDELKNHRQEITEMEERLNEIAKYRSSFKQVLTWLAGRIEFERVHANMGEQSELAYITGFIPEPKLSSLQKTAAEEGWALLIEEPRREDNVPTLVENPKWIKIIQPVFDLLGTVPGYRENDISFIFLIFLSVFFAMIIGDAGYGFIFFGFSFGILMKNVREGKKPSLMLPLMIVMSIATIIWGAITGTWFGSKAFIENSFLSVFVIEPIATFNPRSSETVKHICFIIGTLHITIAHLWKFITEIRKKPRIKAIAQIGWTVTVLGLYYVVLNLVLSATKYPIPQYALYMIFGGILSVLIFEKQEGNFLKGILNGIGGFLTLFLDGISAFSDIISYIRLFAVGLATVEIAKSFNEMAAGIGDGVVGIIGGAIILLFGHTLNLAMGALSVVVHGVRLNMLEFSGHLGMEWTGIPYTPFQEETEKSE